MQKVQRSVHKLVGQVIQNISSEHAIDIDVLNKTVAPLLDTQTSAYVRCKGLVASKNNKPVCRCRVVPGTEFCRKHAVIEDIEYEENHTEQVERSQCTAVINRGGRCLRHAKPGHDVCGIHLQKQTYIQRQVHNERERVPCIHYKENEDHEDLDFCTKFTLHSHTWFCKKHTHLQTMYERIYGAKSVHDYMQQTNNKSIDIVDNFIKDNPDVFSQQ